MPSLSSISREMRPSARPFNIFTGALLVLRGCVGVWYAGTFLAGPASDWNGMFVTLADYLLVDGGLGIVVAALLYRDGTGSRRNHLGSLGATMLVDAVGRTLSGYAVHRWPGIPGFPVTAVIFIALMAVFTITLGVVEAGLVLEEDVARLGHQHARAQFSITPVLLSAMVSVAFGAGAMIYAGEPTILRTLLAGYVAGAGGVMFAMAWSRRSAGRA